MTERVNVSPLWNFFDKIEGTKRAICQLCDEEYSYSTTTGNLKSHLRKKHHAAYVEVLEQQEQTKLLQNAGNGTGDEKVIYEYIVSNSPTSSVTNEPTTGNSLHKNKTTRSSRLLSRDSRPSISDRRRPPHRTADKPREKRLLEELTEEKIGVTVLQKELVEKELEEKKLKIQLLHEEMEHKKEIYEWEKRDKEHKSEMNELEKQEKLLKLEILKANLERIKGTSLDPDS